MKRRRAATPSTVALALEHLRPRPGESRFAFLVRIVGHHGECCPCAGCKELRAL